MCGRSVKKLLALLFLLSCCWLLPIFSSSSLRAEKMYQISESELAALERNSNLLEVHSKQKDEQLTLLRTQLDEANRQLEESRKQSDKMQESLTRANKSLDELEKEAKDDVRVKSRQLILWKALAFGAVGFAVYKATE